MTPKAAPAPLEYIELVLCRDVYHCTPPVLRTLPLTDIQAALAILETEEWHRQKLEKERKSKQHR